MNDNILRQNIIDELEFEPSIDAANIGVAVDNGVVTLTGHVSTFAQKATAENAALSVKGVKGLAQEIEVRPYGSHVTTDEEIAKRALHTISWNTVIPEGAVQVKVQNGWVTLTGKVDWQYQKAGAANAIQYLAGVLGVYNNIEVKPHASVSDVKKRIEDALKRNAEVEAKAINVTVSDGKVRLDGKVHTWAERSATVRAAWAAPGVHLVEDRIMIA
ncbi:ornithine aminotransferase [Mesorhizobium sp. SEMIA 3007]|uniref:BON domain-containing protein n=1 Tax=Mesorhizobium sp. SEMIA 3007 TaxID=1862350 RepID=UPI00083DBECB|nr:BON domain-containing protein [Mesorhizobium sp. SEMIA 3007]ODA91898.1 ornithine aminotransferase [Mesorhizobium sp. SEMIA 3007]